MVSASFLLCYGAGVGRLQVGVKSVRLPYKKALERPFFTASLVTEVGALLESHDSLPGTYDRGSQMVHLDVAVDLTTVVNDVPESAPRKVLILAQSGQEPCAVSIRLMTAARLRSDITVFSPCFPSRNRGNMSESVIGTSLTSSLAGW